MADSKGWDWENAYQSPWLVPSEDSYYLANKWSDLGFKNILDLGAGLGRHSILFSKYGFNVSAIDISEYAVNNLKEWSEKEKLQVDIKVGDMLNLPYADNSFDSVFACHSISHADTAGTKKITSEIERVLRPGGEIYVSMCSKDAKEFKNAEFPKIDENTLLCTLEGPEKNVPHFYADIDDIISLFKNFDIEKVRHTDYCYINSKKQDCKHYYITARKK